MLRASALSLAISALAVRACAAESLYIGFPPTLDRPLFVEIFRQAIFVRASYDCGLTVADASMRVRRGRAAYRATFHRADGTLEVKLLQGKRVLGSLDARYPTESWDAVSDIATARKSAVTLLTPICRAAARYEDGPELDWRGPADAFSIANRINTIAMETGGPFRPHLRAMALAYALLGKKTEFLAGPYPKVFFARSLALAQDEADGARRRATPVLALALDAAGRPGDALRMTGPRRGDDSGLVRLVRAWAHWRGEELPPRTAGWLRPWADYVRGLLTAQDPLARRAFWSAALRRDPADLTAYHFLTINDSIDVSREMTERYLASTFAWKPFVEAAAGRPPSRVRPVTVPETFDAEALLARLHEIELSGSGDEVPGSLRAVVALDFAFDSAVRRLYFLKTVYGAPAMAESLGEKLAPLLAVHPWSAIVPVDLRGEAVHRLLGHASIWKYYGPAGARSPLPGSGSGDMFTGVFMSALASNGSPVNMIQDSQLAKDSQPTTWGACLLASDIGSTCRGNWKGDERFDDVRLDDESLMFAWRNKDDALRRYARRLQAVDPFDTQSTGLLAETGDAGVDDVLKALQEQPKSLVLLRTAAKMAARGDAETRRKAAWTVDALWKLSPGDEDAANALVGRALVEGRPEDALSTLSVVAKRDDGSLLPADAIAQMSRIQLRMGRKEQALILASQAARSYSADNLLNLAFVLEKLGRNLDAEKVYDAIRDRYGEQDAEFPRELFHLRIGHPAARPELDAWLAPAPRGALVEDEAIHDNAPILGGKWEDVEKEMSPTVSLARDPDARAFLWLMVSRLRQGLPLSEAIIPAARNRARMSRASFLAPIARAYLGEESLANAERDMPLNPGVRVMGFYFLSQLAQAQGDMTAARRYLKRSYDEIEPIEPEYTLVVMSMKSGGNAPRRPP